MKTIRLFAAAFFLAAFFAVSAFAQTAAGEIKIAFIDTSVFGDAKSGITKYINGMSTLRKEFEPLDTEIKAMGTRFETLQKEIEGLQKQPNAVIPPAKVDEYGKLRRDIQFKQEDAKARYQSRFNTVMNPIMMDISRAIQDYARQKGYTLIFDGARLQDAGLVLASGDDKIDVTKDFISFYNARPATSGTAATPGAPK